MGARVIRGVKGRVAGLAYAAPPPKGCPSSFMKRRRRQRYVRSGSTQPAWSLDLREVWRRDGFASRSSRARVSHVLRGVVAIFFVREMCFISFEHVIVSEHELPLSDRIDHTGRLVR